MGCQWCGEYWDENCTCGPSGAGSPSWQNERCKSCLNYVLDCVCICEECNKRSGTAWMWPNIDENRLCKGH